MFNKIVKDEDKTSFLQFAIVYKIRPITGSDICRWEVNPEAGTSLESHVLTKGYWKKCKGFYVTESLLNCLVGLD